MQGDADEKAQQINEEDLETWPEDYYLNISSKD